MPLSENNNVVDGEHLLLALSVVDANDAIYTKAQAPSVRFVTVFVANGLV